MVATLPKGVQRLVFSFRRNGFDIGDIQMEAVMQRMHLALHARGYHREQAGLDGLPSLPARVSIRNLKLGAVTVLEGSTVSLRCSNSPIAGELMKRPTLTERQQEVLALLVQGNTMIEAANILEITPRTVAFHKYRMMSALEITSNAELIRYAVRRRIG